MQMTIMKQRVTLELVELPSPIIMKKDSMPIISSCTISQPAKNLL